jgi:acyl-CoA synthetase (AMP-forming)/AMP-acid ligase II
MTIANLLANQARGIPDDVYAIFPDAQFTFGALDQQARAVAKALIAMGIRPGDHIATLMPNCADWLPAYFGGLYAGATVVALNARYKRHELDYTIRNRRARILLTTDAIEDHVDFVALIGDVFPDLEDQADPAALKLASAPDLLAVARFGSVRRKGILPHDDMIALGRALGDTAVDAAMAAIGPEDPAAIIYTSGTTSNPKGCVLTHGGIQRSWYTFAEIVDLRHGQKVWMPMPFFHTGGIGPMTAILSRGAAFMTQPHFEADSAIRLIEEHRIDHLYPGFPQMSLAVLDHPDYSKERFGFVRSLLNVGPPAMQQGIQDKLPDGAPILNLFGMTEGSGIVTFTPFDAPLDLRLTSSGLPPAHTEVRIIDPESGDPCPPGEPGEIQFRGGGAFKLYYRDAEATAATILPDGWVRTGDRGELDDRGYLYYLGRLKDMLKVGGENVAAAEIEFFLSHHPEVKMVQVIGGADARMGEVPIAFVERVSGGKVDARALIEMCEGQLARWKIPVQIIFVTEWPMSTTKVQKFRLEQQLPARYRKPS